MEYSGHPFHSKSIHKFGSLEDPIVTFVVVSSTANVVATANKATVETETEKGNGDTMCRNSN